VRVEGNTVHFSFVGKKGKTIEKPVQSAALASMIKERLKGKKGTDKLFSADEHDVRDYMRSRAKGFTPKDFRTRHATALALETVSKMAVPKTQKALKSQKKEVAVLVSQYLGNTPTVALSSYINPAVFAAWEAK
jgi:DNA topoisomerase-1